MTAPRCRMLLLLALLAVTAAKPLEPCPGSCRCFLSEGLKRADCRQVPEWADRQSDAQDVRIVPPAAGRGARSHALHLTHFEVFPKVLQLSVTNRSLAELIPSGFHGLHSLQELDLSNNLLERFNYKVFKRMPALRRLSLAGNPIILEPGVAFITSKSLLSLDLSHCDVVDIPKGSLDGLRNLTDLSLRGNPLRLEKGRPLLGSPRALAKLAVLDLSACELEALPAGVLDALPALRRLYLDGNSLRTLERGVLPRGLRHLDLSANLMRDPPTAVITALNLTKLELSDNPVHCTCAFVGLQAWLSGRPVMMERTVVCAEPAQYRGVSWSKVDEQQLCSDEAKQAGSNESSSSSSDESSDDDYETSSSASAVAAADDSLPYDDDSLELPPASYEVYTHENNAIDGATDGASPQQETAIIKQAGAPRSHSDMSFYQADQPADTTPPAAEDEATSAPADDESASKDEDADDGEEVEDSASESDSEADDEKIEKDAETLFRNADTIAMGTHEEAAAKEPEGAVEAHEAAVEHAPAESEGSEVRDLLKEDTAATTPESSPEAVSEAVPEVETEATPEPVPEASTEAASEVVTEAVPEAAPAAVPESAPEAPEAAPEAPEAITEVPTEATPEGVPESALAAAAEAAAEAGTEPPVEAAPEAVPEAAPEAVPEAAPEAVPEAATEATTEAADASTELAPAVVPVVVPAVDADGAAAATDAPSPDADAPQAAGGAKVHEATTITSVPVAMETDRSEHGRALEQPDAAQLPDAAVPEVSQDVKEGESDVVPVGLPAEEPTPAPDTPAEPEPTTPGLVPVVEDVIVPVVATNVVGAGDGEGAAAVPESPAAVPEAVEPEIVPETVPEVAAVPEPAPEEVPEGPVEAVTAVHAPEAGLDDAKRNEELAVEKVPDGALGGEPTEADLQKSTITYVILGFIVATMIVLVLYAVLRKARGKRVPLSEKTGVARVHHPEHPGTEMKDLMNPLLGTAVAADPEAPRRTSLTSLELIREEGEDTETTRLKQGADDDDEEDHAAEKPVRATPDAARRQHAANGKPANGKPANGKTANGKTANGKPANGKPANGKPANGKPANGKPANGKAAADDTDAAPAAATPSTPGQQRAADQPSRVTVKASIIPAAVPRTPVLVTRNNRQANGGPNGSPGRGVASRDS